MDDINALYPQLSERERAIIFALAQASQAVSSVLQENNGTPHDQGTRRHREATLSTARAALIHARHTVQASGLEIKLSTIQRALLAECSVVDPTP